MASRSASHPRSDPGNLRRGVRSAFVEHIANVSKEEQLACDGFVDWQLVWAFDGVAVSKTIVAEWNLWQEIEHRCTSTQSEKSRCRTNIIHRIRSRSHWAKSHDETSSHVAAIGKG
jgi:hypothetical protein